MKSFRSCGSASSIYCTFLETSFGIGDDDGQLKLCRAWDKVKGRRSSAEDAQSVADLTVQVKHAVDPFERHKAERDSLTGEEKRILRVMNKIDEIKEFVTEWHSERIKRKSAKRAKTSS